VSKVIPTEGSIMHVDFKTVMDATPNAKVHPYGFQYVVVRLDDGDTMENPASTKHVIYGPGLWLWELHDSGNVVREYDVERDISREVRAGAAVVGG
jgi:hypothetical protein